MAEVLMPHRRLPLYALPISPCDGAKLGAQTAARAGYTDKAGMVSDQETFKPIPGCAFEQRGIALGASGAIHSPRRFWLPARAFRSERRRDYHRPSFGHRTGAEAGSRDGFSAHGVGEFA